MTPGELADIERRLRVAGNLSKVHAQALLVHVRELEEERRTLAGAIVRIEEALSTTADYIADRTTA